MDKKTNLIKSEAEKIKSESLALNYLLDDFNKKLDAQPTGVQVNKHQGNSKYLPISHVQNLLNKFFMGRWQVRNFTYCEKYMQLCGSVELWVFHPITKEWIIRDGVAATQIRCSSGTQTPIKAGLTMDLPRLKADCIKNAAKGLGKVFGRDLNRDSKAEYNNAFVKYTDNNTYSLDELKEEIGLIHSLPELKLKFTEHPFYSQDENVLKIFEQREKELKNG